MILTDKLKGMAKEAAAVRESLSASRFLSAGSFAKEGEGRESGRMILGPGSNNPRWVSRVMECADLISAVKRGRRPDWHLKEAMTVSDFPLLFGDLLYRQLLGNYEPWPVTYPTFCRQVEVVDFRKLHLYTIDGGQGLFTNAQGVFGSLNEYEPYPEVAFKEGSINIQVAKYGKRYGISFEMLINDDLNAFQNRPMLMATGARRSEEYLATSQVLDTNGPHAAFFGTPSPLDNQVNNIIPGNPPPGVRGLQAGFKQLGRMKDKDGQPIVITAVTLLCAPDDEVAWQNTLNATQIRVDAGSKGESSPGENIWAYSENWMKTRVKLVVNPYFPYIASTLYNSGNGSNPWVLVADPNDQMTRPGFIFGTLRGRKQPQLFMKDPDQISMGGGMSDPTEGSFNSDSLDYKLRHIMGACQGDPRMAVASNGSGS